ISHFLSISVTYVLSHYILRQSAATDVMQVSLLLGAWLFSPGLWDLHGQIMIPHGLTMILHALL
ncbi:MAG: hypothetical protein Q4A65_06880, partial [Bacillota bacterium]|nr:hypothetical protein [Bacillota bacterium]